VAHKGVPKRGTEPGAKAVLAPDAGGAGSDERGPRCVKELGISIIILPQQTLSMLQPSNSPQILNLKKKKKIVKKWKIFRF
jgi:hypothetical protein